MSVCVGGMYLTDRVALLYQPLRALELGLVGSNPTRVGIFFFILSSPLLFCVSDHHLHIHCHQVYTTPLTLESLKIDFIVVDMIDA